MSVSINTVTIGGVEDRRMALTNSQAARVIDIGTNWSRLRIAMRYCFSDSGANVTGTPRLYFGVLSSPSAGMANGPLGNSTSHFFGMILSGTGTLTRNAGPPVYYSGMWNNNSYAKKIGSTITAVGGGVINPSNISATPSTNRNVFAIDITKGAPNFTVTALASVVAAPLGITDISNLNDVITSMALSNLDTGMAGYLNGIYGLIYNGSFSGAIATSEAVDGFFNSVCVAWDRVSPEINISEILWAKMA